MKDQTEGLDRLFHQPEEVESAAQFHSAIMISVLWAQELPERL